ncbi:MAG TPA: trypsin-like peptidase domain-containing protein [Hymenobacter sp.]
MKKRITPVVCGVLVGSMLLQSCATILSTSRQTVRVVGQPAGSTFYVNDQVIKTKPVGGASGAVNVRLSRKKNSELKIKHEGYKDYSEVVYPAKQNPMAYLNWIPVLGSMGSLAIGTDGTGPGAMIGGYGLLVGLGGALIDNSTGANKRLNKSQITPAMIRLPTAVAGSQTVQCGLVNVRIKGGDKMGNFIIEKDPTEILYFGKSLDVDADHLKANVNSTLKDLGFSVPGSEGRSVFSMGSNSRFTLQGEMRDVKYDIHASNKYESLAHFETHCKVEVTWKLVNQNRQTVLEQKTSGSSVKFEKGGSAAFEDAFENALYTFMSNKVVSEALAKPSGSGATAAADDKPTPITLHRASPGKFVSDNGVSTAARSVVIVETTDGHGSGCIISPDGYIVTNAHVVGEQEQVKVLMADGVETKGQVIRVNPDMDLALVKVDADGLQAFQLPNTSLADIGADVFAIGTPADKELGQTVTKGIISGRRKIDGHSFLQTDVSINGGNSGGALVTRSGQLMGIVNAKLVGRGIEGIGFAIPAEQVTDALQLKIVD